VGTADRVSPVATSNYVAEARRVSEDAVPRLSSEGRRCPAAARDESRSRDDDHVGTEHVLLALWAIGPNEAADALEEVGVSRDTFCEQLFDEPGPSPEGVIPFTPRALMIVGLAGVEMERLGSRSIGPEHLLLGEIREAEYRATFNAGPQHLMTAIEAAGSDSGALESALTRRSG
jgi:ATP-dependent Clp protease ATP-binding subunit ClpA